MLGSFLLVLTNDSMWPLSTVKNKLINIFLSPIGADIPDTNYRTITFPLVIDRKTKLR